MAQKPGLNLFDVAVSCRWQSVYVTALKQNEDATVVEDEAGEAATTLGMNKLCFRMSLGHKPIEASTLFWIDLSGDQYRLSLGRGNNWTPRGQKCCINFGQVFKKPLLTYQSLSQLTAWTRL